MAPRWRVKRERKPAPRGRLGAATGRLLAYRRMPDGSREERPIPGRLSGGWYCLHVAGHLAGRMLVCMTNSGVTSWPACFADAEEHIARHGIEAMTTPASRRRPMRVPGLPFGRLQNDGSTRIVEIWRGAEKLGVLESVRNMYDDGWEEWTGADCGEALDGLRSISEPRLSDAKAEARREIVEALAVGQGVA